MYNVGEFSQSKMGWIPFQDIANKWQEVRQLVPSRDSQLQNEMAKQQRNERLRRDFAAKANVVGKWIENQLDAVASITIQMRGSLEDQLGKLHQYEKTVQGYKPHMDELESINQVRFSILCQHLCWIYFKNDLNTQRKVCVFFCFFIIIFFCPFVFCCAKILAKYFICI